MFYLIDCKCGPGSVDKTCHVKTGQCNCKENMEGIKCAGMIFFSNRYVSSTCRNIPTHILI